MQTWAQKSADKDTREWLKAAEDGTKIPFSPKIGWAKIAFVHAFQHLLKGSSYIEAIRETFRGGGDTGTCTEKLRLCLTYRTRYERSHCWRPHRRRGRRQ